MDLKARAVAERLRIQRDDVGDLMVVGRRGYLWQYSTDTVGMTVLDSTPKIWGNIRRESQSVGMTLRQDGDLEGTLTFDLENRVQWDTALRLIRVRRRRVPSQATLDRLAMLRKSRGSPHTGQYPEKET